MDTRSSSNVNLKQLLAKLGHSLEEIRVRALLNVLSKLDHGILCDSDLVHERHLHIRLLEWFNFVTCPLQDKVLGLILRMSQHSSAAQIYVDIGTIDFLSQLRPNIDSMLHRLLDTILDNLFHLPTADSEQRSHECIYNPQADAPFMVSNTNCSSSPSNAAVDGFTETQDSLRSRHFTENSAAAGYFGSDNMTSFRLSNMTSQLVSCAKCFKFATFPWIALNPTDKHVLLSTDELVAVYSRTSVEGTLLLLYSRTSVRSKDITVVLSVCEFLSDVVFQDFPAEVFLQRPNIVKSLLSLLTATSPTDVLVSTVQTLCDLSHCLNSRISYHQDPALFTAKHDCLPATGIDATLLSSSSSTSQSLSLSVDTTQSAAIAGHARHRGDGQDVDNTTSSSSQSYAQSAAGNIDMIEQTDIDDVMQLEFSQWNVAQYCVRVLERIVPCLRGSIDEQLTIHTIELLHAIVNLLQRSVDPKELWEDNSLAARELVENFTDLLESLCTTLDTHHHSNLSPLTPDIDVERHRVTFIGLAVVTVQLLKTLVPSNQVALAVPKECCQTLSLLCFDRSFCDMFPVCGQHALDLVTVLDPEAFTVQRHVDAVCQSLDKSCQFIHSFQQQQNNDECLLSLLQLAQESLLGLQYHVCLDVVDAIIQLCSVICKKSSAGPTAVTQSRAVLIALLSHNTDAVRCRAYISMFEIIKDALGVEHVVEPTSSATLAAMFIVDAKILYQLTAFGSADCQQIKEIAEKTVLYLIQSQLLVPSSSWQHLLEAVAAVHGMIQSVCETQSMLGRCIIGLLETDPRIDTGTLPVLERFRGCLRLMLHKDPSVRVCGAERAIKLLAMEDSCSHKLPSLSDIDLHSVCELFIIKSPRSLSAQQTPAAVFQASDLKKVYDIFTSKSVELAVRRSAAEQLAVILNDVNLHSSFIQLNGLSKVIDVIQSAVTIDTESTLPRNPLSMLLPSLLRIIRCLVEKDFSLRHRLAHQTDIYYAAFRSALLHHRDDDGRREISELMCLLLFDEMASVCKWDPTSAAAAAGDNSSAAFSLPAAIVQRYQLPFIVSEHHERSPWSVSLPLDTDTALLSGLPAETLRIVWNAAWHDGIEAAITAKNNTAERYSARLSLTHMDQIVLSTTYLPHALKQLVYAINNATSHGAVSRAILRLRWYLVIGHTHSVVVDELRNIRWKEAISRFLLVAPSTATDEQLLMDVVQFLSAVVSQSEAGSLADVFDWIADALLNTKGAMYQLLVKVDMSSVETDVNSDSIKVRRQLGRCLLCFIRLFVSRYPYHVSGSSNAAGRPVDGTTTGKCVHGDLVHCVLGKINRVDSVQSYNLPSLELTLLTLMHLTARRGWSVDCTSADCLSLCLETLQSLLEVVSSFHAGRGGLAMSYMGCGITRCAAVCLRQLAHEMSTHLHSQEWPRNWLFTKHAMNDAVGESGLHWLFPLWTYRDIQVQAAGTSIAAALTSTEAGRITMATQCHNMPGGIWGAAFSRLLDHTQCSLTRQQAALLLVNLTSQVMPTTDDTQTTAAMWQGPVVRNEETQVSLFGLPALFVLLHHLQFYDKVCDMLSNVYVQPTIHPATSLSRLTAHITAAAAATAAASVTQQHTMTTLTTSGSMSPHVQTANLIDLATSSSQLTLPSADDPSSWRSQVGHMTPTDNNDTTVGDSVRRRHVTGEGQNGDTVLPPSGAPAFTAGIHSVSQSSTADSDVTLTDTDSSCHSVVTPCLVSAVSSLLSNIVALSPDTVLPELRTHGVIKALTEVVNERLLRAYISDTTQSTTPRYKSQLLLSFTDLVTMHRHLVALLTHCVVRDAVARNQFLEDTTTLRQILLLLAIAYPEDIDASAACTSLWTAVLELFANLLLSAGQEGYIALAVTITRHWSLITARLLHILQDKVYLDSSIWFTALNFIALLLSEDCKLKTKVEGQQNDVSLISEQLDNLTAATEPADSLLTCPSPTGSLLCQSLVRTFDVVILKPQEQFFVTKALVINALKSLLAVSVAAKTTALEVGLFETLCDHVRHLHNQLNIEALELVKTSASSKKKMNPAISELMMTFDLLRNFLFDSDEVKSYACKSSLASLVHCVWSWCQTNVALMSCTLSMLCAYTAHCPPACSSLAFTTASSLTSLLDKPTTATSAKHSSNSLVHCLLRLIQKESVTQTATNPNILRLVFALVATLTVSTECRGIMWKSNFLLEFSTLSPQKTKKTKTVCQLESLWLSLFVNLSFSTEGQNLILKIDDALPLLVEFAGVGSDNREVSALLVLRNLCFHASNKQKLLANDKLLPLLLRYVESGTSFTQSVACSALLALVYNNQKAKGLLKNALTLRKLRDVYNCCMETTTTTTTTTGGGDTTHNDALNCAQTIRDLLTLLRA